MFSRNGNFFFIDIIYKRQRCLMYISYQGERGVVCRIGRGSPRRKMFERNCLRGILRKLKRKRCASAICFMMRIWRNLCICLRIQICVEYRSKFGICANQFLDSAGNPSLWTGGGVGRSLTLDKYPPPYQILLTPLITRLNS